MRIWSEVKTGKDGLTYNVRYILTQEELESLQVQGLISRNVAEVVGMQTVVDEQEFILEMRQPGCKIH